MSDVKDKLLAACNGHPATEIPWPHRLLHEAHDEIARLERELAEAKAEQRTKDADIARTAKISCFDDGIMFNQACEKIARAIEDQEA